MNVVLWVIQAVLAAAFIAAGAMKLGQGREKLMGRMGWVQDRTDTDVRIIGGLEVLGGVGLIVPGIWHWPSVLTTLAALGLALTMVGAVAVHLRRDERSAMLMPIVFLVLALLVLWGRLGPYPL